MNRMRVLKWVVPVDDEPHAIGQGVPLLVATQNGVTNEVVVWTNELVDDDLKPVRPPLAAQVFGTGQIVDAGAHHVGSCVAGLFVWHVFVVDPT